MLQFTMQMKEIVHCIPEFWPPGKLCYSWNSKLADLFKKKMYSIEICSILVLLNTLLYFIKYIKEGTFSFSTKRYNAELSRWQYYNYLYLETCVLFTKSQKCQKFLSPDRVIQLTNLYIFTYKRSSITLVLF